MKTTKIIPLDKSELYCEQFYNITELIIKNKFASISFIQRNFNISFPKASKYIEELINYGYLNKKDTKYLCTLSNLQDFYIINPFSYIFFEDLSFDDKYNKIMEHLSVCPNTFYIRTFKKDQEIELMKFFKTMILDFKCEKIKDDIFKIYFPNSLIQYEDKNCAILDTAIKNETLLDFDLEFYYKTDLMDMYKKYLTEKLNKIIEKLINENNVKELEKFIKLFIQYDYDINK